MASTRALDPHYDIETSPEDPSGKAAQRATCATASSTTAVKLLAAIKLVALFGEPARGNTLVSIDDFGVLTELALAINSLSDFGPFPEDTTASRQLAAQLAPSRELENLPRLDNALVRSRRMLGDILKKKQLMPLARELEQLFVFLTNGFSFDAFRDMLFGIFSYFQATVND